MKYLRWLLTSLAVVATIAIAAQAQVPGVNSTIQSVFNLAYDVSTMKPTYSASQAAITLASSPTDVCILNGSATKNVRVRRVIVAGLATTVQSEPVSLIFRSTANSGGTSGPLVTTPYDTTNSLTGAANAGTAIALAYTANPTVGTVAGVLADPYMTYGNLTTGVGSALNYEFGARGSPVVLRGVAQGLAVNLNALTATTGQLGCTFEWTEE